MSSIVSLRLSRALSRDHWSTRDQSSGMVLECGSTRSLRCGSCSCVQQLAMGVPRPCPLKPFHSPRRYDDQRVVIRTQEDLLPLATGRGVFAVVENDELDSAPDAGVVQSHIPVQVPSFNDMFVYRTEVDLAEFTEVRIADSEHVIDRATLIGNSAKRHDLKSLDQGPSFSSSGTINCPPASVNH